MKTSFAIAIVIATIVAAVRVYPEVQKGEAYFDKCDADECLVLQRQIWRPSKLAAFDGDMPLADRTVSFADFRKMSDSGVFPDGVQSVIGDPHRGASIHYFARTKPANAKPITIGAVDKLSSEELPAFTIRNYMGTTGVDTAQFRLEWSWTYAIGVWIACTAAALVVTCTVLLIWARLRLRPLVQQMHHAQVYLE